MVEIPVSMNLAGLFQEVERAVPRTQRAADAWSVVTSNAVGDVGVKYELRRDPLTLTVGVNTVGITTRVRYWFMFAQSVPKPIIGGSYWQDLGSCGVDEPPREAVLGLQTRLTWNENWGLDPVTTVPPVQFTNRCEITFLKFDVTAKVQEGFAAGLKQGAALADARIRAAAQFKPMAEGAWRELSAPILLAPGMWLVMNPQAPFVGPLKGQGTTVTGTIGFTAQPRIVFGPRPNGTSAALPKPATSPRNGDGFHVMVEGRIDFDDASRRLTAALAGETYTYVGHDVRVTRAALWGAGEKAVLELLLAGDVNGTIYLLGTPAYDPAANALYVKDLDYSLETTHALANAADWMLHGTFRRSIADEARWGLDTAVADVKGRLSAALNRQLRPGVGARANIGGVRPAGVYVTDAGLVARVAVDGTLRLDVK